MQQSIETLSNWVLDTYPDAIGANTRQLKLPKGNMDRAQLVEAIFKVSTLQPLDLLELLELPANERSKLIGDVLQTVGTFIRDEKTEKYRGPVNLPESYLERFSFIPLNDIQHDEVLLYNSQAGCLSELDFKSWERPLDKETKAAAMGRMRDSIIVYDPYDLTNFTTVEWEAMEVLRVNTYQPPKWRLREGNPDLPCPEIIDRLLTHIFPDPTTKRWVINWIRTSLLGRNEVYMVLNGKKGLGKGILTEYLLPSVVGSDHYTLAPLSLLTSQFNAAIDRKRIIAFDEVKVTKQEYLRLKRLINKWQNIEKKGVDADKRRETYNSYTINNNDITDMYLEYDDRRFGVPDMNTERLEASMSREEIKWLTNELENPDSDLVWQFGYWVFYHGEAQEFDPFHFIAGRRFWQIVYSSLTEWQKYIVDKFITEGVDELELRQATRDFTKEAGSFASFPRSVTKIEEFLNNYLHEGQRPVAKLGRNADGDVVLYKVTATASELDGL